MFFNEIASYLNSMSPINEIIQYMYNHYNQTLLRYLLIN